MFLEIDRAKKLTSWEKVHELSNAVNKAFVSVDGAGFKEQIEHALSIVKQDIAKGKQSQEMAKSLFFSAKAKCSEIRTILYLSKDMDFLSNDKNNYLIFLTNEISKSVSELIKNL